MAKSEQKDARRVTTHVLQEMKAAGQPIAMLTAYDYSLAGLVDSAGVDVILVGDSASNVMAGHETTLPITLDQMIYHGRIARRGTVTTWMNFNLEPVTLADGTALGPVSFEQRTVSPHDRE